MYFDDPKRLSFVLARYKFVAKMLSGTTKVCEVGCADAFGTPLVAKEVQQLNAIDFDSLFIEDAQERTDSDLGIGFFQHDVLTVLEVVSHSGDDMLPPKSERKLFDEVQTKPKFLSNHSFKIFMIVVICLVFKL